MKIRLLEAIKDLAKAAAIAAFSLLLAIVSNLLHPVKLPLAAGGVPPGIPAEAAEKMRYADAREGMELVKNPELFVVDVRDETDYLQEHIPGAIPLPYRDFNNHFPRFVNWAGKDSPLLLYGYGPDSPLPERVGKRLINGGFEYITILESGFDGWRNRFFDAPPAETEAAN